MCKVYCQAINILQSALANLYRFKIMPQDQLLQIPVDYLKILISFVQARQDNTD